MERAQREADGPRRRILEAARLKTVARVPEAAAASAEAQPAPPQPVLITLTVPTSAPLTSVASPIDAALRPVAKVDFVADPAPLAELPPAIDPSTLPPPQLQNMVAPDVPGYLLRRGARRSEVVVDLIVNTDGSVDKVSVRNSPNAELEAAVVSALRQWRYDTQPVQRAHVVRLVIGPG